MVDHSDNALLDKFYYLKPWSFGLLGSLNYWILESVTWNCELVHHWISASWIRWNSWIPVILKALKSWNHAITCNVWPWLAANISLALPCLAFALPCFALLCLLCFALLWIPSHCGVHGWISYRERSGRTDRGSVSRESVVLMVKMINAQILKLPSYLRRKWDKHQCVEYAELAAVACNLVHEVKSTFPIPIDQVSLAQD